MTAFEDLRRGWELPGDSVPFSLSGHARTRFAQRLRREGLPHEEFKRQLSWMLSGATVTASRPDWATGDEAADAWLLVGGFAAPLVWDGNEGQFVVKTVLAPSGYGEDYRHQRNEQRSRMTHAKRASKRRLRGRAPYRRQDSADHGEA